jgi:hypothetical protein
MYTDQELRKVATELPEDFTQKSEEFWNYVRDKLNTQRNIRKIYYDSLVTNERDKALEFVKKSNERSFEIIEQYMNLGAILEATEDPLLVQEAFSWFSMLQEGKTDLATEEMIEKNMGDRDKFVTQRIAESLNQDESGILFLAPGRRIDGYLPADIRLIKIQPFDPSDYLNSWLVTLSLKTKQSAPSVEKQS